MPALRCLVRSVSFLVLSTLIGCSGSKSGSLATVSGVVTHNGNPVEGAKVIFHSTVEVEGKTQAAYGALTDSSGKYVIATSGKEPGIPPGLYKVTITKLLGKGGTPEELDPGQMDAMISDVGTAGKGGPVNLLPREYATLATSKLSATLDVGKNDDKNFDLKGKAQ